ncbi:MAG: DUF1330 domain-containing protein [Pseudomonadota bacterium]
MPFSCTAGRLLVVLLSSILAGAPALAGDEAKPPTALDASYTEGQLMSIISIDIKPGEDAAAARANYLRTALGLAKPYGLRVFGSLTVTEVIFGDFKPRAVAFYAWPSLEAEAQFDALPEWLPVKATRPDGWLGLRFHDTVVADDLTLRFASDKYYTMATAWVNPDRPNDYDTYLARIEPALNAVGGRFVYKMIEPSFATLSKTETAPSRLTFVEWDTPNALDAFLASKGFQQNAALLNSGTTAFELVRLSVPKPRTSR